MGEIQRLSEFIACGEAKGWDYCVPGSFREGRGCRNECWVERSGRPVTLALQNVQTGIRVEDLAFSSELLQKSGSRQCWLCAWRPRWMAVWDCVLVQSLGTVRPACDPFGHWSSGPRGAGENPAWWHAVWPLAQLLNLSVPHFPIYETSIIKAPPF